MATYLYCVLTSTGAEPPKITGIGGAPVRALVLDRERGLEAWVASVSESSLRISGHALGAQALVHNDVVSAALESGRTPLPARFGSHFEDDAACLSILARRACQLYDGLTRLAGMVEMSVLIVPPHVSHTDDAPLPGRAEPAAGRRYLEMVRDRARRVETDEVMIEGVVGEIGKAVGHLVRAQSRSRRPGGIVSIAHLVRRQDIVRYREILHTVAMPGKMRLIIAGPRAPYSFVESAVLSTGHDSGSPNANV